MDKIKTLLCERLETELKKLSTLEDGSEEQIKTLSVVERLHTLLIEEMQAEAAQKEKEEQQKLAIFGLATNVGLTMIPFGLKLFFDNRWFTRGLKYEETGSVSSFFNRSFLPKILSRK